MAPLDVRAGLVRELTHRVEALVARRRLLLYLGLLYDGLKGIRHSAPPVFGVPAVTDGAGV